jgi:hypothetical protein
MTHIGNLIEHTLHEQGRTVTWFAAQLCCTRPNIYKLFRKESIDMHLLWRISSILGHDFFMNCSSQFKSEGPLIPSVKEKNRRIRKTNWESRLQSR